MDEDEKEGEISIKNDAILSKIYELSVGIHNHLNVHHSLNLPSVLRHLFIQCGLTAKEGSIGLRACLSELYRSWSDLKLTGECHISFTKEQLEEIDQDFQPYQAWQIAQELAREFSRTDADGWNPPDVNFEAIREGNKAALEQYIEFMSKRNVAPRDVRKMWPFLENV